MSSTCCNKVYSINVNLEKQKNLEEQTNYRKTAKYLSVKLGKLPLAIKVFQ